MKETYFEIYGGEDGVIVNKITDIDKYLEEMIEECAEFLGQFPEFYGERETFNNYSCDCIKPTRVLIKGRIVVPKKKEIVKKYVLEE